MQWFEIKNISIDVYYKHSDIVGYLQIIVMFYQLFGLSFWRHPFTAEDPLVSKWCDGKFIQICSDEETNTSTSCLVWESTFSTFLYELFLLIVNIIAHINLLHRPLSCILIIIKTMLLVVNIFAQKYFLHRSQIVCLVLFKKYYVYYIMTLYICIFSSNLFAN